MGKLNEAKKKIEDYRKKMDRDLEEGKSFNDIYEESLELDRLIEDYLNMAIE